MRRPTRVNAGSSTAWFATLGAPSLTILLLGVSINAITKLSVHTFENYRGWRPGRYSAAMSEPGTSDHSVVTQHVRTTMPYRVAVWYLRSAMVSLPLALINLDLLWPIWPSVIGMGVICTVPVRGMAYFEWKLRQIDLAVMIWRDAFDPRFR